MELPADALPRLLATLAMAVEEGMTESEALAAIRKEFQAPELDEISRRVKNSTKAHHAYAAWIRQPDEAYERDQWKG